VKRTSYRDPHYAGFSCVPPLPPYGVKFDAGLLDNILYEVVFSDMPF